MQIRRIVTSHEGGKSVFASDERIDGVTPNIIRIWGADELPVLPVDGTVPPQPMFFPPDGGFRFILMTLPPASQAPGRGGEMARGGPDPIALPGAADVMESEDPGMHTTDSVDMEIVLEGEFTLELDDGAEVTAGPGDVIIQNGTRHRWHNRGSGPATMAVVLLGTRRKVH